MYLHQCLNSFLYFNMLRSMIICCNLFNSQVTCFGQFCAADIEGILLIMGGCCIYNKDHRCTHPSAAHS